MKICKICQQESSDDQQFCSNCGYPLTTFPPTLGEIPQAFQEILSQRERWEKEIWQQYEQLQQQKQELFDQKQQLQQKLDGEIPEDKSKQRLIFPVIALFSIFLLVNVLSLVFITHASESHLQEKITNLQQENTQLTQQLNQKLDTQNQSQQQLLGTVEQVDETVAQLKNTVDEVPLQSSVGYDYRQLRNLLEARKWKQADKETANAMLQVAGRGKRSWLRPSPDIDEFPCEDLRTIDHLWVKYSNGQFGFSVQKEIYQKLGGTDEFDKEIYQKLGGTDEFDKEKWHEFGDAVGWRENKQWRFYSKYGEWWEYSEFRLKDVLEEFSVKGHLPCALGDKGCTSSWGLFSRADACGLSF